jgi:hypothetical protein
MPLGNALAGPLSHAFGTNRVLIACAAVLLGSGLSPLLVRGTHHLGRRAVDLSDSQGLRSSTVSDDGAAAEWSIV